MGIPVVYSLHRSRTVTYRQRVDVNRHVRSRPPLVERDICSSGRLRRCSGRPCREGVRPFADPVDFFFAMAILEPSPPFDAPPPLPHCLYVLVLAN